MQVWTHDRWRFPLPEQHRFPLGKYALLRARLAEMGIARPDEVNEPDAGAVGVAGGGARAPSWSSASATAS